MKHALKLAAAAVALALAACAPPQQSAAPQADAYAPRPYVELQHPDWAKKAVIYQINTRQFTPEGTFKAAEAQLPRLKDLGVDILWLMPIHEIGVKNRKGTLGSPYSVKDYLSINHEFGTEADFKAFVDAAHKLGMRVIIDWVANHTAWDNAMASEHPDWYDHDWKGDFRPTPWFDWSDIIDLDYSKPGLRAYMTKAMLHYVKDDGVDGFRCDTAGFVPLDFWENARAEFEKVKPVFMLAEYEGRDVHKRAFDATYAWTWDEAAMAIGKGRADAGALVGYYSGNLKSWPHDAYRMVYTSNHDKNAWEGTEFERLGPMVAPAMVLSFVGEGIPLIYNGQEAGNAKRLQFFEKDPIQWRGQDGRRDCAGGAARCVSAPTPPHPNGALLKKLTTLKHETPALWNGEAGARMVPVVNDAPAQILSFTRFDKAGGVFAVFNLSKTAKKVSFSDGPFAGDYTEYFTGEKASFDAKTKLDMPAWSYKVYVKTAQ